MKIKIICDFHTEEIEVPDDATDEEIQKSAIKEASICAPGWMWWKKR